MANMYLLTIYFLLLLTGEKVIAQVQNYTPILIPLNSGRPTFNSLYQSLPGKIALEEHVGDSILPGVYTTPFVNYTNELTFDLPLYIADIGSRMQNIDSRVASMNAANISISVLMFASPGIQGVFNTSLATYYAAQINDEVSRLYTHGNYSSRFKFWCSNALQDPVAAAKELDRCVNELGGVGSFIGGYTNMGSANNVTYLDDPSMAPFLEKVVELDVPIYLHPREPPPDQQRVYKSYEFLAGSIWGFSSETVGHVLRLMVSGVFDRYPTLKIILGHCGEGLPPAIRRMEARMRHFQHAYEAKESLRTYWERNFWVTTSGVMDDTALWETIKSLGEERVMFSVDYPFEDTVEISAWFDRLEMNGRVKKAIGSENARELLKLGGN